MLLVSAGMLLATWLLLKKTRIGLIIQASLTHPGMVSALGHDVPLVFTTVFAGGSFLAGLAGVIAGNYLTTESGMADAMGPIVFVVVIFGGLGSLAGCFIASILMGMVQTFSVVIDYSFADLVKPLGRDDRVQRFAGRNPHHSGIADRAFGAVCVVDPHPGATAARADGYARNMSDVTQAPEARVLPAPRSAASAIRYWPWLAALLIAVALPWLFYDWHHARHAGFVVSVLSQTGMMIIFALSFNMLMGQAGLLSFCHSVLFGLGRLQHGAFPECGGRRRSAGADGVDPAARRPGGPRLRHRVRLRGDQAAFHRVRHDHARHCAAGHHRGHDVPSFLWRRGRHQTDRMIGRSLFGLDICAFDRGLLSHRGVDDDCRHRHVFPHQSRRLAGWPTPAATTMSGRSSSATIRAWCGSCNLRCPAFMPALPAGCSPSPMRSSPSMRSLRRWRRMRC